MGFDTPILFLIFNRPGVTYQVFERIREIKPKKLFVAADGPRKDRVGEKELCEEARMIIHKVDWDCDVQTLFREENKGCGPGVSEAISWFFSHVEQGIILEDDILPATSFFRFCEELLDRYKNDDSISVITGTNFLSPDYPKPETSYFFSEYVGCWGWASWRRAWKGYDYTIATWASESVKKSFRKRFRTEQFLFFSEIFDAVCLHDTVNTWDYQWWYQRLLNSSFGIIPSVNMVRNIGFDADATHTFDAEDKVKNAAIEEVNFPLVHPLLKKVNTGFDLTLAKKQFWRERPTLAGTIKGRLSNIKNKLYSSSD